jgi:hypothetical protein
MGRTVNAIGVAMPSPGLFDTKRGAAVGAVRAAAGIVAWTSVLLMEVTGRTFPFHVKEIASEKSLPVTVIVVSWLPARTNSGLKAVSCGTGLR